MIDDQGERLVLPHHQDQLGQDVDFIAGVGQEKQQHALSLRHRGQLRPAQFDVVDFHLSESMPCV
jgi:hypothetical protein